MYIPWSLSVVEGECFGSAFHRPLIKEALKRLYGYATNIIEW